MKKHSLVARFISAPRETINVICGEQEEYVETRAILVYLQFFYGLLFVVIEIGIDTGNALALCGAIFAAFPVALCLHIAFAAGVCSVELTFDKFYDAYFAGAWSTVLFDALALLAHAHLPKPITVIFIALQHGYMYTCLAERGLKRPGLAAGVGSVVWMGFCVEGIKRIAM
jgi:hypothetical protein